MTKTIKKINPVNLTAPNSNKLPPSSPRTQPNEGEAQKLLNACWQSKDLVHQMAVSDRHARDFRHEVVTNIAKDIHPAEKYLRQGKDIYFAPAEFKTGENRKADNIVGACCFWLDIDCGFEKEKSGKGYTCVDTALEALEGFCKQVDLQNPSCIINSGNGLHVYWLLDKQIKRENWQEAAKKLKALTQHVSLKADHSRTADIASLLRIPATLNYKYNPAKPVEVLTETGKQIDVDTMMVAIESAYQRLCTSQVVQLPVTKVETVSKGLELERIKSALSVLNPDCSEAEWKLKRLAPLAMLAREHPAQADKIKLTAMAWSRGDFQDKPSRKWETKGINGQSGEELFEVLWQRFLSPSYSGEPVTVATIIHDAKSKGWLDSNLAKLPQLAVIQEYFALMKMAGKVWVVDREALKQKGKHLDMFNRVDGGLLITRKAYELFGEQAETKKLVSTFYTSPNTTCFDGIEFNPVGTTENCLNLWAGPTIAAEKGSWSRIKTFLYDIVCNKNDEYYQYLINYFAHMVQRPEEKPGVMIILLGGQGIGKGTLGRILQKIWNASYLQVHNVDSITGSFNAALEQSFVVFMDEALFSGDRRAADALKSLVTEPTVYINEKHQPARQMKSFHRFFAATNADHFKNTERDDRRDFVLRVSDERKNDAEYWTALNEQMTNGGVEALLYELENIDLTNFNVRAKPSTYALVEQKILSLDHVARWWHDSLEQGYIEVGQSLSVTQSENSNQWPEFISTADVIEEIENTSGRRVYKKPIAREVIQAFGKFCPSAQQQQKRIDTTKKRGLAVPPLEQARKEFEQFIGGSIEWPDVVNDAGADEDKLKANRLAVLEEF